MAGFQVGDLVILARVRHDNYRGQKGYVHRVYKTKEKIRVRLLIGSGAGLYYDALPGNLDKVDEREQAA